MRNFALFAVVLGACSFGFSDRLSAQSYVAAQSYVTNPADVAITSSYVCPQCGKIHSRQGGSYQQQTNVVQTSGYAPASNGQLHGGRGTQNVLATLNAQRSRQGVGALQYDPTLQAVAERRAQQMASMGMKSHPPGSFSPGRYEGVGWSSSYSPSGVSACFTNDRRMTAAGAAMATGRDGVYFAVVYR